MCPLKRSLIKRSVSESYCLPFLIGSFWVKAIQRLSGLKIGGPPTPGLWNASPPGGSIRKNQGAPDSSESEELDPATLRREVKPSRAPSALQRGFEELNAGLV